MAPAVYHCRQKEIVGVYIGRPTCWGNPFKVGVDGTREQVIAKYEDWIKAQPPLLARLDELRGRNLLCWCKPKPCHGDVLLRLANAGESA